ncbi:MAG: hypothetical protein M1817_004721 [Caeruleum heppii]|nr:MAG: hypothetical protein M1817_004721 [Caeruleum heppii]
MAAAVENAQMQTASKASRKKKSKAETSDKSQSLASSTLNLEAASPTSVVEGTNAAEGKDYESPYVQELQKSIRNATKKINATAKVDAIIAENPGKSLDELVTTRKINNDQKAQALKKPSLEASRAQLQEQVAQYQKFDQDYQARLKSEKLALRRSHDQELDRVREETKTAVQKEKKEHLLLLSKFLRLAAAKRQEASAEGREGDILNEAEKAFEGLLSVVYLGDEGAVSAFEKLFLGANEAVLDVTDAPLDHTYAQIKQATLEHEPYQQMLDETGQEAGPNTVSAADGHAQPVTDPTIAHAGLTELSTATPVANGVNDTIESPAVLQQSSIDAEAANEAAETRWDERLSASVEGEGWVEVPRDPAETDTGLKATPAAMSGTQSWADDQPTPAPASQQATNGPSPGNAGAGDGFHEVHHSRGGRGRGGFQGERRGSFRGRGGRGSEGGFRGRGGFRGDRGGGEGGYRGRGRGGFRGGRGRDGEHGQSQQHQRRQEEAATGP